MLSGTWKLFNEIKIPLQSPGSTAPGEHKCLLFQLPEALLSVYLSSGTKLTLHDLFVPSFQPLPKRTVRKHQVVSTAMAHREVTKGEMEN